MKALAISNKVYDVAKYIVAIILPALASACAGLGALWNLGHTTEVVGTITILNTFLGAALMVSNKQYNKDSENIS